MPNVAKVDAAAEIGAFVERFRLGAHDEMKLRIKGRVMTAQVKRTSGRTQSATSILGEFHRVTTYDPSGSPAKRRRIVWELYKEGHKQVPIAGLLGISQATVSLDLKWVRAMHKRKRAERLLVGHA